MVNSDAFTHLALVLAVEASSQKDVVYAAFPAIRSLSTPDDF